MPRETTQNPAWANAILNIPDYPKKGVNFKDITPLIANGSAFHQVIEDLAAVASRYPNSQLACPEARGFMFGSALAYRLKTGFLPIRKPGKLPRKTCEISYALEYGEDKLQMHAEDIIVGQDIVLVDDVLATGGTINACIDLLQAQGAQVRACLFVMALDDLKGAERILAAHPEIVVHSLVNY